MTKEPTQKPQKSTPKRHGNIFLGVALLLVGIVLLGNNLGWFEFSIGLFFRYFWPLILIAIGLRLVVRNMAIYTAVVALMFGGALAVIAIAPNSFKEQVGLRTEERQDFSQPLAAAKDLSLKLDFGAGDVNLGAHDDSTSAYKAIFTNATRIKEEATTQSDKLSATLQQSDDIHFWGHSNRQEAKISVSQAIPVEFEIDAGASKANLDFSAIMLKKLKVDAGASTGSIKFGTKVDKVNAEIDAGASSLELYIPESAGLEIIANAGLSTHNFDALGLTRSGDTYRSANYEGQARKISITLDAGASSITLKRY